MKIFVTGDAGMVGSELTKELNGRAHEVVGYDLQRGQDIANADLLWLAMQDCQAVIHLAAIPHPDPARRFEDYYQANVNGTHNVVTAAIKRGIPRLVYASSTAYYGAHRGFPFNPGRRKGGFLETTPNAVQCYTGSELPEMTRYNEAALAYACSKVAAETVLAAYGLSRRLEVIILRMAPVIGIREPYEWGLLLYVEEAARALADAVEMETADSYSVFNVCNPDVAAMSTKRWQDANAN